MWTSRGSLEPADVAVELCLRNPAAAADVYGTQIPALHERVHRRTADAEDPRGLFGREEETVGGHEVQKRLRIIHIDLSRISRVPSGGLSTTVRERPAEHLQCLISQTISMVTVTHSETGAAASYYCRSTGARAQYRSGAPVKCARRR